MSKKYEYNWTAIRIGFVIALILGAFIYMLVLISGCWEQIDIGYNDWNKWYWDEVGLVRYILETKTDLDYTGGGRGKAEYRIGEKYYLIHCYEKKVGEHSVTNCCKEGEIKDRNYKDAKDVEWVNIIYEDSCY